MKKEILKKSNGFEAQEMKWNTDLFPGSQLSFQFRCYVLRWGSTIQPTIPSKLPTNMITATELHLYRRLKALFNESREISLGSRELSKILREEGFYIVRYRPRTWCPS